MAARLWQTAQPMRNLREGELIWDWLVRRIEAYQVRWCPRQAEQQLVLRAEAFIEIELGN